MNNEEIYLKIRNTKSDIDSLKKRVFMNLEEIYSKMCTAKSDINEHLPTLHTLAKECKHITELGRHKGHGTIAFMAAKPEKLVSYDNDIINRNDESLKSLGEVELINADTREIEIEETDLIFFDSSDHSYDYLRLELERNGNKARKYLVFHDTIIFGEVGTDGKTGILPAINEFLSKNPHWQVKSCYHTNNGLMILERIK